MPLFMDRHDIANADADAVARAHQRDREVQARHACKAITYWYDEPRSAAFCLVEAPSAAAVRAMHAEAHGMIPNQIIEVDASEVRRFLGRMADPEGARERPIAESALRAILFVDLAQSTDLTRALGDAQALVLMRRYRGIVRQALVAHRGREIDRAGDGFLASFESAYAAVTCAIAIQRTLERDNAQRGGPPLAARIGIGAGEPVQDGEALFGSAVNLTSRICSQAGPGEIVAARVVRELCLGKNVRFQPLGAVTLKGFDQAADLERVAWRD
jgi:class 3 adenylate cyclase